MFGLFGHGAGRVNGDAVREVAEDKAQLLDVRRDDEWQSGHADGALHIEVDRLLAGDTSPLDRSRQVYVYCRSGARAGAAVRYLNGQGYRAQNIGGLSDWSRAGGPVVR